MIIEKEIYRLADIHRRAGSKSCIESLFMRKAYNEYVSLIIEEEPEEKRRGLSEMYERLKEETDFILKEDRR